MSENAVVRARIDERIKNEAALVLSAMGLTVSDAFRMMMTRIAAEKSLPFDPLVPNPKTIAAMKEARRGGLPRFDNIDALMVDLNEGD
ncbi:MAG: type II toxin-antitoxin system RelB/DinJ family antitoxin [Pseudomonadota bacterium]|nr:type II toxin-antitoxin system RelB/DinJ family antitoxin [Pseudomonadota bacterium]